MARFTTLEDKHADFIRRQKIFFVGTAAPDGRVNVSPKGMDSLRVLDANRVVWQNLTGSGNETAAHLLEINRMTLMFTAFEGPPLTLRLYGSADVVYPGDAEWDDLAELFPRIHGSRQVFDMTVDLVQTSCGFSIPFYEYVGPRDSLAKWFDQKSIEELEAWKVKHNTVSLDGKPTGLPVTD